MPSHRFFVGQPLDCDRLALDAERSHQITRVLRLRAGDRVVLFNGDGREVPATIDRADKHAVWVTLGEPFAGRPLPRPAVHLAQGVLKSDRFDWVVQKATELGVEQITPLITERTVVSLSADRAAQRLTRWRKIAIEAAEQSGRPTIPQVNEPSSLGALAGEIGSVATIVLWEDERATSLATAIPSGDEPLLLLIGPEGGFDPREVDAAVQAGARTASLGPLILRSETAAVAAIAGVFALAEARRTTG